MEFIQILDYIGFSIIWEAKRLNWVVIFWIALVSTLILVFGNKIPEWTLPVPYTYSSFC